MRGPTMGPPEVSDQDDHQPAARDPGETMTPGTKGLAIGETDAHVFNCPSCARPLANGTSRCPGCRSWLIMGVRVKRAGGLLALGLVLGGFFGGVATVSVLALSFQGSTPAAVAAPSLAPVVLAVIPSGAPTAVPLKGVPAGAVSALSGTAVVNGRIAVDAVTLELALAGQGTPGIEIARALRSLAADATLGIDLTGRLGSWTAGASVMSKLDDFYRSMAKTAQKAFKVSLIDVAAYRRAGEEMMTVLAGLGGVDAASRSLATTLDLELPPVALPGARRTAAPAASTAP